MNPILLDPSNIGPRDKIFKQTVQKNIKSFNSLSVRKFRDLHIKIKTLVATIYNVTNFVMFGLRTSLLNPISGSLQYWDQITT